MKLENNVNTDSLWEIYETRFIPDQAVTTGSNYMIGNGYLGYRGTFADDGKDEYVACVLTDTYDNADGKWKELVTAPNVLYTELVVDGSPVRWRDGEWDEYRRDLNVRYGEWSARARWKKHGIAVVEERFADADDIHLLTSRMQITAESRLTLSIRTGIDGDVWSLHGRHLHGVAVREADGHLEMTAQTGEHAYDVVAREQSSLHLEDGMTVSSHLVDSNSQSITRTFELTLEPGQSVVLVKRGGVYSTNDLRTAPNPFTRVEVPATPAEPGWVGLANDRTPESSDNVELPPREELLRLDPDRPSRRSVIDACSRTVKQAQSRQWEDIRSAHRSIWDKRWADLDVHIAGDDAAQLLLRYNMYQNVIATPMHTDHLPIGARGLSCQAYQGAAFWDQEIFNLPVFLFTQPEIARKMLVYRYRTLDGARKKARDLGYYGAYYAWISGASGAEICPSYFFKDVVSGRRIRNHFNDRQIHISPDIAYTVWRYVTVTDDREFLAEYGAEIVFEVARFIGSRACYRADLDRYHLLRVLGPDEYHENVDNNAFTNYQSRFAVQYAIEVHEWMAANAPQRLQELSGQIALGTEELDRWRDLVATLYVPGPDQETGIIPQFDGFFRLEDTRPELIEDRLIDPGEYWGWPNGIAVPTQVSKQADVVQLFMLHPHAFSREVMRANWEYYEPRTQHGSSLSPAVYAVVAAWVGHMDEAERYFKKSCTVDLYNTNKAVSGGTFIGGIHTAAAGVSRQIVVSGFAGMYLTDAGIGFEPHLPASWETLTIVVQRWDVRLTVTITPDRLEVVAAEDSPRAIEISLGDQRGEVDPGGTLNLKRGETVYSADGP